MGSCSLPEWSCVIGNLVLLSFGLSSHLVTRAFFVSAKRLFNSIFLTLPDSMCCPSSEREPRINANGRECNTQNSRSFASIRGSKTQHRESGRVRQFPILTNRTRNSSRLNLYRSITFCPNMSWKPVETTHRLMTLTSPKFSATSRPQRTDSSIPNYIE